MESKTPLPENDRATPAPTTLQTTVAVESPSPGPTTGLTTPPETPVVRQATPTVAAATPTPAPRPSLKISAPSDGSVMTEGDVKIYVEVSNFKVVNKIGQANVPGEGHIIYYRDVDAIVNTLRPAINPLAWGGGEILAAYDYTWPNVYFAPGFHTFSAQLVNNDMTSLNPPVVAKVTVKMAIPVPPVDLTVQNGSFSRQLIEVNAGADVVINFQNRDTMTHNFAIYDSGLRQYVVFRGKDVLPGQSVTYRFKAPTAGYYLFQCDYHSGKMIGTFSVWEVPPTPTR